MTFSYIYTIDPTSFDYSLSLNIILVKKCFTDFTKKYHLNDNIVIISNTLLHSTTILILIHLILINAA